ncbi:hypothetical protein [Endozoicomonas euniceicola]|uniref:Uncharacterized protein n=1 Tax=Endozoicomonas euniceicola TaxID=1234143 RepID=A0ABY6GZJ1_9GAMM|nr:hypothetical protein [Endozoicomonas euniceicola]UYM18230.1 hypothetical protein NX720_10105 [Endozoicomonas euniceicola]
MPYVLKRSFVLWVLSLALTRSLVVYGINLEFSTSALFKWDLFTDRNADSVLTGTIRESITTRNSGIRPDEETAIASGEPRRQYTVIESDSVRNITVTEPVNHVSLTGSLFERFSNNYEGIHRLRYLYKDPPRTPFLTNWDIFNWLTGNLFERIRNRFRRNLRRSHTTPPRSQLSSRDDVRHLSLEEFRDDHNELSVLENNVSVISLSGSDIITRRWLESILDSYDEFQDNIVIPGLLNDSIPVRTRVQAAPDNSAARVITMRVDPGRSDELGIERVNLHVHSRFPENTIVSEIEFIFHETRLVMRTAGQENPVHGQGSGTLLPAAPSAGLYSPTGNIFTGSIKN